MVVPAVVVESDLVLGIIGDRNVVVESDSGMEGEN